MASPHLEMYTTAEAETAAEALNELESLRLYFRSAVPESATKPVSLRIVAFSSEWEYQVFRLNSYSPAYFVGGSDQRTIVLGRLARQNLTALRHEYIHALAQESGWHLPLWLGEGLADQLAGMDAPRVRFRATLLKRQGLLPIRELTSVNSPHADEAAALRFYASSWALTHLLFTEAPYRDCIWTFLKGGDARLETLLALSGRTEEQLQSDLDQHVGRLNPVPPPEGTARGGVRCDVMAEEDTSVQLTLARLQVDLGNLDGARTRLANLTEAARMQPAYWGLMGDVALRQSNDSEARYSYEKAMDLGSEEVPLLTRLAMLNQTRPEVIPVLERILALSPGDDAARLVLTSHYVQQKRWPEAMAQLRRVREVPPDRQDYYSHAMAFVASHLEPSSVMLSTR
ncbi:tetratricopeptide repeat protein [uncultured Paludibaculum sp.]|uniref:tetratricopeptide repeat protein n=1 Tax=uncultured Paludibaculum sp. TaxID=1765020 RepID=UPI002AAC4B1D|nr:tetratricopeptide repeat protein [uncultured Paludibaculum sp.]